MKTWLVVDEDGDEAFFKQEPKRGLLYNFWISPHGPSRHCLKEGSIEKLIGRKMSWADEPYEQEMEEAEIVEKVFPFKLFLD